VDRCLSFCTFSFGHCVVYSSSIYRFWLPPLVSSNSSYITSVVVDALYFYHVSVSNRCLYVVLVYYLRQLLVVCWIVLYLIHVHVLYSVHVRVRLPHICIVSVPKWWFCVVLVHNARQLLVACWKFLSIQYIE